MCQDVFYTYDCGHRIRNTPTVIRCEKCVKSGFDCWYRSTGKDEHLPGGAGLCRDCLQKWEQESPGAVVDVAKSPVESINGFWKRTVMSLGDLAKGFIRTISEATAGMRTDRKEEESL